MREYIGARYVTKIYENTTDPSSAEWQSGVIYEPLVMVTYNNGSYLSKKTVPANIGNPASNPTYWVQTGFYNGQVAALRADVDQLIADMITTNDKIYHIEDFSTYKRGHSLGHTKLQGGCYIPGSDEIVAYVDDHLMKFKSDGTFIMQNDIAFVSHYNAITYNSKTNKVIIGGGGDSGSATQGLAVVDPITLTLDAIISIDGADYIHVAAYDDVNNVYYLVDHSMHGFIIDADDYTTITTFAPVYNISGYTIIRQSGFCLNGQFYNMITPKGESNRLYCYNVKGSLLFESDYTYLHDYEPEFIANTPSGVVMGYLDTKLIAEKMLIFDFQSPSVKYSKARTIYVDETLSANGNGTDEFPYNDLAFAAYEARGESNITISIRSDISKHGVIFTGIDRIILQGANHTISSPDVDGVGIYFRGCCGDVLNCKFETHVRCDSCNINMQGCSFDDISSTWALVASNASNIHLQTPVFNNCTTCVRMGYGSRVTMQGPTGSGNGTMALIQNCAEFICNYTSAIANTDATFNQKGLAIINGTPSYT